MARIIRFPLIMKNGTEARTLEDLKENFDLESVLGYFTNGKLATWLRDRYYEEEANSIEQLSEGETNLNSKICEILGIPYNDAQDEADLETIKLRNEKLMKLKQLTSDETIIKAVDSVAFSQDEMFDILDDDIDTVYLYGEKFSIPFGRKNVRYIGINTPLVLLGSKTIEEYEANEISFEKVRFEEGKVKAEKPQPVNSTRSCGSYTSKTALNSLLSLDQCEAAEKMYNSIAQAIFNIDFDIDADVHNMKRIINDAHICDAGSRYLENL